ncbi:MAG: phage tail assembly protein [Pseudomonadales bacterium]|nr:phage tail assembly protein [Pseudomonadales bacterium]
MRKHTLKFPYTTAAGSRLESVEMRRLTRGDVRKATQYSKDDFEQENYLLAAMCSLVPEDLDKMDIADSKVLLDFFRSVVAGESEPASS